MQAMTRLLLLIPNTLITRCVYAHMYAHNMPADPEAALHNRSCLACVTMTMSKHNDIQTTPVPRPSHNENDYRVTIFLSLAYCIILSLLGREGGGGGTVELDTKINTIV